MMLWNGVNVNIDPGSNVGKLIDRSKQNKTLPWLVGGMIALGLFFIFRSR